MKPLYLALVVAFLVAACTPRGFRPPPEPYEEFAHIKGRITLEEIKASMIDCGYLPEWGFAGKPEKDYQLRMSGKVTRLECMFQKGFYLKDGWGGYCADPNYQAELSACANVPMRSLNNYYGQ